MKDYNYLIIRNFLFVIGGVYHIYDNNGNLVAFSKQEGVKFKDVFHIYRDENKNDEIMQIRGRNLLYFNGNYDVFEPNSDELIGSWQRKGFSSLIRDKWVLFDKDGKQICTIIEDTMKLAILRRLLANFVFGRYYLSNPIPQAYDLFHEDAGVIAKIDQSINPIIFKIRLKITQDEVIDKRLIFAGAFLLSAIEGRQY